MNMICVYILFMLYFDFGLYFLEINVFVIVYSLAYLLGRADSQLLW